MNADLIDPAVGDVVWTPPWRPVTREERRRLVVQLAREVSTIHPLSGQLPQVIGVRDRPDPGAPEAAPVGRRAPGEDGRPRRLA